MRALWLGLLLCWGTTASAATNLEVFDTLGGDFQLESTLGKKVGPQDFRGKVLLLFFGYTSCPDICPVSLTTVREALKELSAKEAQQVQPLFVSVDPERDTLEGMKQFLSYFHPSFVGLTGSHEELKPIVKKYGGAYMKDTRSDTAAGYLVAHSGYIYLMDQQGRIRALFRTTTSADEMAEAIESLLEES